MSDIKQKASKSTEATQSSSVPAKKRMRTASLKAKGRRLAQELRDLLLAEAKDLLADDIRVTPSGSNGPDLMLSPAAQSIFPFSFECKNVERLNVWEAIHQAEEHCEKTLMCVVFRRNNSRPYGIVAADVLVMLMTMQHKYERIVNKYADLAKRFEEQLNSNVILREPREAPPPDEL